MRFSKLQKCISLKEMSVMPIICSRTRPAVTLQQKTVVATRKGFHTMLELKNITVAPCSVAQATKNFFLLESRHCEFKSRDTKSACLRKIRLSVQKTLASQKLNKHSGNFGWEVLENQRRSYVKNLASARGFCSKDGWMMRREFSAVQAFLHCQFWGGCGGESEKNLCREFSKGQRRLWKK